MKNNYVISDIHGNFERFEKLFELLEKKHPNHDFTLHIIGDVFDRGDESYKLFKFIRVNQNNIKVVLGNHEVMFADFMVNPKNNFEIWHHNGAYNTICSFVDFHLSELLSKRINIKKFDFLKLYFSQFNKIEKKLSSTAGMYNVNLDLQECLDMLKYGFSKKDARTCVTPIRKKILEIYPKIDQVTRQLIENIAFIGAISDFCEVFEFIIGLDGYEIVDDKFLLVHSGYVSRNVDINITDNVDEKYYNDCETAGDLINQNLIPMVWSRRVSDSGEYVAPQERFDNLIIVYGHTPVNRMNGNSGLQPLATYNHNQLASIGIDGCNYDKVSGQLNCVCLEDLSVLCVKGIHKKGRENKKTIAFVRRNSPISVNYSQIENEK